MGTDVILTGRDGEGSRALSEDESRNLYLNANAILVDIAEGVDRDLVDVVWAMNGFPEEMKPSASVEDVAFKDAKMVAETLADMVDAGHVLAPDDEAFDVLRELLGLPKGEPIDPKMLAAMNGQPDPEAQPGNDPKPTDPNASKRAWVQKAEARPLYVHRPLLNADVLIKWAKAQGFEATLPADDMHVTVLFSRASVDPMQIEEDWVMNDEGNLIVPPGGPRLVERLGPEAVVLLFGNGHLKYRHSRMIEAGASHDYPEYQPHVTITYKVPSAIVTGKR